MKRASYRTAVQWMADNDDTGWLELNPWDVELFGTTKITPSVTASLVADLFGVPIERVTDDLRRAVKRHKRAA